MQQGPIATGGLSSSLASIQQGIAAGGLLRPVDSTASASAASLSNRTPLRRSASRGGHRNLRGSSSQNNALDVVQSSSMPLDPALQLAHLTVTMQTISDKLDQLAAIVLKDTYRDVARAAVWEYGLSRDMKPDHPAIMELAKRIGLSAIFCCLHRAKFTPLWRLMYGCRNESSDFLICFFPGH